MDLKRIASGKWFTRLVFVNSIACAVSIYALLKSTELVVHGQLYSYGLIFSSDWAGPLNIYMWLIYVCLGLTTALGGFALVSSFLKVEKVPEKKDAVPTSLKPPQVANVPPRQMAAEVPKRVENGNGEGICCPHCKKVFCRALVMLDFYNGRSRLVSVCPYCSHVLGNTSNVESTHEEFHVAASPEKIIR